MSTLSIAAIADTLDSFQRTAELRREHSDDLSERAYEQGKEHAFRDAARFVRDFGQLKWSSEVPTEEGWYWMTEPILGPSVKRVITHGGELAVVYAYGFVPLDRHASVRWAGPIPFPVEETTP